MFLDLREGLFKQAIVIVLFNKVFFSLQYQLF